MFGSLDGVIDDVKSDIESTGINSVGLHDLYEIALLEAENDGLKGGIKARDELSLIPFVGLCG